MGSSHPTPPRNRSGAAGSHKCPAWRVPGAPPWHTPKAGKGTESRQGVGWVVGLRELGIFSHSVTGTGMERRGAAGAGTGPGMSS